MNPSPALSSLQDIASYLGPVDGSAAGGTSRSIEVLSDDRSSLIWPRSDTAAARFVAIIWDDARHLVRIRVPLPLAALGVAEADRRAVALAVAKVNCTLEVVGLELDDDLVFVAHAFHDADGRIATSIFDQLLAAIDACETRVITVFAELRDERGAT